MSKLNIKDTEVLATAFGLKLEKNTTTLFVDIFMTANILMIHEWKWHNNKNIHR